MTEAEVSLKLAEIDVAAAAQRKIIADAGAEIAKLDLERATLYAEFRKSQA